MRLILPFLLVVTIFALSITQAYITLLKRPTAIVELLELKHDLVP